MSILFGTIQCLAVHAEQRRARLDLVGRTTSDGAAHVLGAIPPQVAGAKKKVIDFVFD